jgi:pyridoxine 5-phosphate synthase
VPILSCGLPLDSPPVAVLQRGGRRRRHIAAAAVLPYLTLRKTVAESPAMAYLGVNIDHVATVREARKTNEPDPVWAASLAELGGADGITLHLREDRRHIQERDLHLLRQTVTVKLNLELACDEGVLAIACQAKPFQATLVPERREEVTTEGGLDVVGQKARVADAVKRLRDAGIAVSLFLDPDLRQIDAAVAVGAEAVELHTGAYAHASARFAGKEELATLRRAGQHVAEAGLTLHAGHGLTYRNVQPVAALPNMCELNIGHSIIARAIMIGLEQAVRDMKRLIA